jgi:hypothetical protein
VAFALTRPFVAEPGGPMLYSTGSSHLLSAILTHTTGQTTHQLANAMAGLRALIAETRGGRGLKQIICAPTVPALVVHVLARLYRILVASAAARTLRPCRA